MATANVQLLHHPQNDGGNQVTSGLFPFGGGVHLEVHFVVSEMQITPVYGACQEQNTIYCTSSTDRWKRGPNCRVYRVLPEQTLVQGCCIRDYRKTWYGIRGQISFSDQVKRHL